MLFSHLPSITGPLCLVMAVLAGLAAAQGTALVPFRPRVTAPQAAAVCAVLGGWGGRTVDARGMALVGQSRFAVRDSDGVNVWLGATRTDNVWMWQGSGLANATFASGANCTSQQSVCPWASGSPSAAGNCLQLTLEGQWANANCREYQSFLCEVPYRTTYQCPPEGLLSITESQTTCAASGGWLATFPSEDSHTRYTAQCGAANSSAAIGLLNTEGPYTAHRSVKEVFRWAYGPLGRESLGLGRMFSYGQPNLDGYYAGYPFVGWEGSQPDHTRSIKLCGVWLPRGLHDDACCSIMSYICEFPATPPTTNCFGTEDGVALSGTVGFYQECSVNKGVVVEANVTFRRTHFNRGIVLLLGGGALRGYIITDSEFDDASVVVDGVFLPGSEIRIASSNFRVSQIVDVGSGASVGVAVHLSQLSLQGSWLRIARNTIALDIARGTTAVTTADSITLTGASGLVISENQITLSGSLGSLAAFNDVNITGGVLEWRSNRVTFSGATAEAIRANIRAASGTEVSIRDNQLSGTNARPLLTSMFGSGRLSLECNVLFGTAVNDLASYASWIPSGASAEVFPCGATPPRPEPEEPAGRTTSVVDDILAGNVKYAIIAGAAGAVALVVIIVVIVIVRRRSRKDRVQALRSSRSSKGSHRSKKPSRSSSARRGGGSRSSKSGNGGSSYTEDDGSSYGASSYTEDGSSYTGDSSYA